MNVYGEITIGKALDDSKTVYMAYRNFADRTREEYQNELEVFIGFLEQRQVTRVGELGLPNIERYVAHLEEKGFAGLTRKVVAIRSFLAFLHQEGYIAENIAKRIIVPFAESAMPHFLTQSECNRIRDA